MIKKILAIMFVIAILALIVGCQPKVDDTMDETQDATTETTTETTTTEDINDVASDLDEIESLEEDLGLEELENLEQELDDLNW